MKYAVIFNSDGNFNIHSEHGDVDSAIMEYHSFARALRSDTGCRQYTVEIVNEQFEVYQDYKESFIRE